MLVCRACGQTFAAKASAKRIYCSTPCRWAVETRPAIERFWLKVDKSGAVPAHCPELGPCWNWTGANMRKGYGSFSVNDVTNYAHRWIYEHETGRKLADCLLHKCDNPLCIRPSHMFEGSRADNAHDMDRKGRRVTCPGDRNGSRKHPERLKRGAENGAVKHRERMRRGENHATSKLTEDVVRRMRALRAQGHGQRAVGEMFGVTQACVWAVVHRRTWKHVA